MAERQGFELVQLVKEDTNEWGGNKATGREKRRERNIQKMNKRKEKTTSNWYQFLQKAGEAGTKRVDVPMKLDEEVSKPEVKEEVPMEHEDAGIDQAVEGFPEVVEGGAEGAVNAGVSGAVDEGVAGAAAGGIADPGATLEVWQYPEVEHQFEALVDPATVSSRLPITKEICPQ